jgi:acetolactate synthase I/II/III large subunit
MNGAQSLLRTLADCGVDTCFMNPGTSEMHFVAALDSVPEMHSVLALFEGVATGACDGYARMTGGPAAALLHLGPGLGNGLANLHNARKGRVPVVVIVGDHATYHKQYDAPLESDIETVARNVSTFVRRSVKTGELGSDAADAVGTAIGPPGQVSTLILPADVSWADGGVPVAGLPRSAVPSSPETSRVAAAAAALRSGLPAGILIGGRACLAESLSAIGPVASATGARLLSETFVTRMRRGAGVVAPERLAYFGEMAATQLQGLAHLILVDAGSPVSFFAYPGQPSDLVSEGCQVHVLAGAGDDVPAAIDALASALSLTRSGATGAGATGAGATGGRSPSRSGMARPGLPTGPLTPSAAAEVIGALLPEEAIVSDEANTSGLFLPGATADAPPHDWLQLTGGAIGQGLPLAVGAAVACPGRRVLALEADGSAMYTNQAWWTMAREDLDVTTVIFANRSYAILNIELHRVGAEAEGPRAKAMLDLSRPELDFVSIARGMGVPATRAVTAEDMAEQLSRALSTPGPSVVEVVLDSDR